MGKTKKVVVSSSSDSDSSSSESVAPVKKSSKRERAASNVSAKSAASKASSSKAAKKSSKTVPPPKKKIVESSDSDSDSSSESEKPAPKKKAAPAKKAAVVSDSDSSSESEKPAPKKKAAAKKAASSSSSSDSGSDSSESEKPVKKAAKKEKVKAVVEAEVETVNPESAPLKSARPTNPDDAGKCELFIKYISENIYEEQIKTMFEKFGELVKCKHLYQKGVAFVQYNTHEEAAIALANTDGSELDSKHLEVTFSVDKPVPVAGAAGESNTVFCGNMGYRTEEWAVKEFFAAAGEVTRVRIAMDRETDRPKGFAHIEFADPASAARAVAELNGGNLDGRAVRLDLSATHRPAGAGGFNGGRGGGGGDRGGRGGFGGGRGGGDRGGRGGFGGGRGGGDRGGRGGRGGFAFDANKNANAGGIVAFAGTKMSF